MSTEKKVKLTKSIGFKIQMMAFGAVFIVVTMILAISLPSIRKNEETISKNYLLDTAKAYGQLLNEKVKSQEGILQDKESLREVLSDVKMHGKETSYAYVVDRAGNILYHPTESKIGQPVENGMVKKLIAELAAGKVPEASCVEYDYRSETRYAAYYVDPDAQYILLISVTKEEVYKSLEYMTMNVLVIAGIVMILVLIGGILNIRRITKPLKLLTGSITKVADLDLTGSDAFVSLSKREDEVGSISRAIDRLHQELIDIISNITQQSERLNDESNVFSDKFASIAESVVQVSQAVDEIAQSSTSQAQETSSASEKVLDMGNAVDENSKSIYELDQSIDLMNEYAESAQNSLNEVMNITDKTMENMEAVYQQSNETNDSAMKIGEAIQLIQDIAEQTNLLSLNASIEAARAGEAGHGFAVVAGEIRRLAESSNESAKLINETVQELVTNSQQSVNRMEKLREDAKLQLKKLREANTIYDSLKEEVGRVSKNSDSIANKIGELTEIRGSVSEAVEQLAAIAEENAASTEETSAGITTLSCSIEECNSQTAELYQMSEELRKQAMKFKF